MDNDIKLGDKVKDLVTGFEGIATCRINYLTGCDQVGVSPAAVDGKIPDTHYFDVRRLEYTGPGINPKDVQDEKDPGGPNRDCPNK